MTQKNHPNALKALELLKISIKARIEDFDRFYDKNFQDFRISFFEKQKFRLRKLLHEASNAQNDEKDEEETEAGELEIRYQNEDNVLVFNAQKASLRSIGVIIY